MTRSKNSQNNEAIRQQTKAWNCHTLNAGVKLHKVCQFVRDIYGSVGECEQGNPISNLEICEWGYVFGAVCLVTDDHIMKAVDHVDCSDKTMTEPPHVTFILGQLLGH